MKTETHAKHGAFCTAMFTPSHERQPAETCRECALEQRAISLQRTNAALLAALEDAVRMLKAWDKEYGSQVTDIARLEATIKQAGA